VAVTARWTVDPAPSAAMICELNHKPPPRSAYRALHARHGCFALTYAMGEIAARNSPVLCCTEPACANQSPSRAQRSRASGLRRLGRPRVIATALLPCIGINRLDGRLARAAP